MYSQNLYSIVKSVMSRTGQLATLIQQDKLSEGTYNPESGEFTSSTPSETEVKVIVMDYALVSNGMSVATKSLIEIGDKECYMDSKDSSGNFLSIHPSPSGDTLVVNGTTWRVINVKEVNPSGSHPVMYNLQLRR